MYVEHQTRICVQHRTLMGSLELLLVEYFASANVRSFQICTRLDNTHSHELGSLLTERGMSLTSGTNLVVPRELRVAGVNIHIVYRFMGRNLGSEV